MFITLKSTVKIREENMATIFINFFLCFSSKFFAIAYFSNLKIEKKTYIIKQFQIKASYILKQRKAKNKRRKFFGGIGE
jgi:hypothetical protein